MIEIHTTGFRRSGNNWIIRLLSSVLASPVNRDGMTWHGQHGGNFELFFHHALRVELQPVLDAGNYVVFNYRDPRSVVTSLMFFAGHPSMDATLNAVLHTYTPFVRPWWSTVHDHVIPIRYEELHDAPVPTLRAVLARLPVTGPTVLADDALGECVARHTIQVEIDRECARRGVPVGTTIYGFRTGRTDDWRAHFKRRHGQRVQESPVGQLMIDQGYVNNETWWHELPE